ncbi:hypothetical protein Tco_0705169, partial [Tanacetum coccineum]
MYRLTYESPAPSPKPNQWYSPLNHINLNMDMENLFNTQDYYAGQGSCQGSSGNHEFYMGQDYSMGHGSAPGSTPVKDDSPDEEVAAPIKTKKVSTRCQKSITIKNKEPPKPWTTAKDVVLCQVWCDVSENNITGNAMKSRGFWLKVVEYFEKETGSDSCGYDAIVSKWQNRVCPRIGAFCVVFNNVQRRNESGSCDLTVYQKVCAEYAFKYNHDFTLEPCWAILRDHLLENNVSSSVAADVASNSSLVGNGSLDSLASYSVVNMCYVGLGPVGREVMLTLRIQ